MKGWNWKKFLALFMAVAMVLASGIFVTNQSFKATDDESYQQEESEQETDIGVTDEGTTEETTETGTDDASDTAADDTAEEEQNAASAEGTAPQTDDNKAVTEESADETAEADAKEAAATRENEDGEAKDELSEETAKKEEGEQETKSEEELAEMPAGAFTKVTAAGVTINASYDTGVFPAGTTMKVRDISEKKALGYADDVVEDVTDAVGVDITFYDKDGNEIQPYGSEKVNVSMQLDTVMLSDEQTMVHVPDGGRAEEIDARTSTTGAVFEGDHFSIYILAGILLNNGSYENKTYSQILEAYEGLTLEENVMSGSDYLGGAWKIAKGDDIISFGKGDVSPKTSDKKKTIEIITSGEPGDAEVTYTYQVSGRTYTDTFKLHINGYVIHFDANGGSGKENDAKFTMTAQGSTIVQLPSGEGLSRDGYTLVGWSWKQNAMNADRRYGYYDYASIFDTDDGNAATTSDMVTVSRGDGTERTMYACWANNSRLTGNIGFFVRDDGTIQTEPGSYSASAYTTVTPNTYSTLKSGGDFNHNSRYINVNLPEYITYTKTETNLNKIAAMLTPQAQAAVEDEVRRQHEVTGKWVWNVDDPNQYVVWYVIKCQGEWHVDGVIRSKTTDDGSKKVSLDYQPNCTNYSGKAPVGKQYDAGKEVKVEGNATLSRTGYTFGGWNTKEDGTGFGYQKGDKLKLEADTTLYAQWLPNSDTPYTLLCYDEDTREEISNTRKVRRGTTGNTIKVTDSDKELEGYKYVPGDKDEITEATIQPDGSTTLKLYFEKGHVIDISANRVTKVYDGKEVLGEIASIVIDNREFDEAKVEDGGISVKIDGRSYTIKGVDVTVAKDGKNAKAVDVGNYTVSLGNPSDIRVLNADGKEANVTVNITDGAISIIKRQITIRSKDGEWEYDGKAHKMEEVEVTCTNDSEKVWADGDDLPSLKYTGSQTAPGQSKNTFELIKNATWEDEFPNYIITIEEGDLKVKGRDTRYEISVLPDSMTVEYNGSKQQAAKDAFTLGGVAEELAGDKTAIESAGDFFTGTETRRFVLDGSEYTITGLSASGEGTDAGKYPITITGNEVIKLNGRDNVTDQFVVNKKTADLVITKKQVTLSSQDLSKVYDGNELTNGDSEITEIGWVGNDGADYTFTGSQTIPGTSPNSFEYALKNEDSAKNYDIIKNEGKLTVTSSNAAYEIDVIPKGSSSYSAADPESGAFRYDGTEKSVSGFVGEKNGGIPVKVNGHDYTITGLSAGASRTDVGTTAVKVEGTLKVVDSKGNDVTSEFKINIGSANLVVEKRNVILTSATMSKEYDGNALTNGSDKLKTDTQDGVTIDANGGVSGDGWAENEGASYEFTGTQTLVGSSGNTFRYTLKEGTKEENYNIRTIYGTLTVKNRDAKYKAVIIGNDDKTPTYDGKEHTVGGFVGETDKGVPVEVGGHTYYVTEVTSTAEGTDAGEYPGVVNGTPKVVDENGNDVTDDFDVTVIPGKLVINKANVTIQSADLHKAYDGKPLVNGTTAMAVEKGWAEGEGAVYTFTGTQTLVGSSANSYTYELKNNTNANNYNIIASEGTLTVTNRDEGNLLSVVVIARSDKYKYDGEEKKVTGFEGETGKGIRVEAGGETYYVSGLTSEAKGTDATEEDGIKTTITGTPVVKDDAGNDVTAQFSVLPTPGTLVIEKRSITLTSATKDKKYDGKPLTNGDSKIEAAGDGWAKDEGAEYTFTGSQTIVGSSPNSFGYEPKGNTSFANYNITTNEGTLTVTNRDARYDITITGKSDTAMYDGKEHTVSGFENEDEKGRVVVDVDGTKFYVTGVTSEKKATNVKESGLTRVSGTALVTDEKGNDVSEQFAVTVKPGTLTITKRRVTLTSETRSKLYDGYPLTNGDGKVTVGGDGLAENETLEFEFTGSQTLAGSSKNTFNYKFGNVGGQINNENKGGNKDKSSDTGAKLFDLVMEVHAAEADNDASKEESQSVLASRIGDPDNYDFEVIYGDLIVTVISDTTEPKDPDDPDKPDDPDDGGETVDPTIVVGKNHEEGVYKKGQEVEFTITAKNIYADKRDITIKEIEGVTVEQSVFTDVEPGSVISTKAHYTITEADIVAGGFKNTATIDISGSKDNTEDPNVQPGTGGYKAEDDVIVEEKNPSLAITKKSNATGKVRVGDVVEYTITAINNGNVAVSDIEVTDELTKDTWKLDKLEAGASREFTGKYTVTESDVAAGKVINTAKAAGKDPSGNDVSGSGDTTDEVNQSYRLTIHYVDESGNTLASDYVGSFQYGQGFYVMSPVVSGYTPQYTFVQSDEHGMPAKDVEVTVPYVKNPTQTPSNGGGTTPKDPDDGKGDDGTDGGSNEDSSDPGSNTDNGSSSNDSSAGTGSGDKKKSNTGNVPTDNSGGTSSGVNNDGSTTSTRIASPDVSNDAIQNAGIVSDGAVVSVDDNGDVDLVAINDQQTPLSNLMLGGDHRCNILAFLMLLASLLIVSLHSRNMRKHQERVFELKEKLDNLE